MSRSRLVMRALVVVAVLLHAPDAEAQRFSIYLAPPRVPQRPVDGNTLQQVLDGFAESIVVTRDQRDGELVASSVSTGSSFTLQVELVRHTTGLELGVYNGHDASPGLVPVFPVSARVGWFAVMQYRNNPTRLVVNVFDDFARLQSSTTYPGGDRNAIGFYAKGPLGTVYSQDARHPGAAAQCLFFAATGLNFRNCWLAMETSPLTGLGGGYDDALWFVDAGDVVSVPRTSWGQLNSRFR